MAQDPYSGTVQVAMQPSLPLHEIMWFLYVSLGAIVFGFYMFLRYPVYGQTTGSALDPVPQSRGEKQPRCDPEGRHIEWS